MGRKRRYKVPEGAEGENAEVDREAHEPQEDGDSPAVCIHRLGELVVLSAGPDFSVFDLKDPGNVQFCTKGHKDAHTAAIRGFAASEDGSVLVSGGDDKTVKAWSTKDWSLIRGCTMAKKVTSVVVTKDGSRVAGADKFGDVYSLELSNDAPAELCLGHMSIITAMALSPCNSLVVTADRDSTIRCSCFPDGYNIESFCLGHATYVSQLLISPSHPDFLFSADGSAELILWKYKTGDLVQRHKFEGEDLSLVGIAFCPATNVLAASMSDKSIVFIRFDGETLDLDHVHRLESPHVLSALNFGADGSLWAAACAVDDKQQPTTHLTVFESKSTPESLLFSPMEEGHAAHATVSVVNADVKTCLESGVVAGVENKRAPKRFKEGNNKTDEK